MAQKQKKRPCLNGSLFSVPLAGAAKEKDAAPSGAAAGTADLYPISPLREQNHESRCELGFSFCWVRVCRSVFFSSRPTSDSTLGLYQHALHSSLLTALPYPAARG